MNKQYVPQRPRKPLPPIMITDMGTMCKARYNGVANCVFGSTIKEAMDRLRNTPWAQPSANQRGKNKTERDEADRFLQRQDKQHSQRKVV